MEQIRYTHIHTDDSLDGDFILRISKGLILFSHRFCILHYVTFLSFIHDFEEVDFIYTVLCSDKSVSLHFPTQLGNIGNAAGQSINDTFHSDHHSTSIKVYIYFFTQHTYYTKWVNLAYIVELRNRLLVECG